MRTRVLAGAAGVAALAVVGAAVILLSPPQRIAGVSIAGAAGPPIIGGATYVTTSTTPAPTTTKAIAPATTTTAKPTTTANTAAPPPPPPANTPQPGQDASGQITFYGAADNDPPGSREIAYPSVLHGQAGGSGTFDDPTTFAAQDRRFAPGTKIYVPDVRRYFILEDSCASCDGAHIDLWTGAATDRGILRCEDSLTRNGSRPYQINPPAGLPVSPGELYHNGRCYRG